VVVAVIVAVVPEYAVSDDIDGRTESADDEHPVHVLNVFVVEGHSLDGLEPIMKHDVNSIVPLISAPIISYRIYTMACWKELLSFADFAFLCAINPMISAMRSEAICSASESRVSDPVAIPTVPAGSRSNAIL